jgi:hypothetical protein
MSSSSELLLAIGPALFGAQWKRGLSRALGLNERTINRWVAEPIEPRPGVWNDLLSIMRERQETLGELITAVEKHARATGGAERA